MSEHAIISPHRGLGRLLTRAGMAALAISGPASATVPLGYGQDYQDAYLNACAVRQSTHVCACEIAAIEDTISFNVFAEAVQRTGGDLRSDAVWTASLPAIALDCFGAAKGEEE